jgi:hypothetical protein
VRRETAIWIDLIGGQRQDHAFEDCIRQPLERAEKEPHVVDAVL